MARKSASRGKKSSRSQRNGGSDPNPNHFARDQGAQGRSINIPPRNYLSQHVAGVQPSLRRTLAWNVSNSTPIPSTYNESAVVILNSPYDPDNALGGVSASGFAKYMAIYSKCFAIAARAKVKFVLAGALGAGLPPSSTTFGATITTSVGALASTFSAIDAGLCDYQLHNINTDRGELNLAVDVSKFVDKPDILDDSQFFCTSGANPSQVIALHVWSSNNGFITAGTIQYVIEVEFDCVFTDPIPFT
jgi:hypothetical protein